MTRLEHLTDVDAVRQVATLLEAENARLHRRIEQLVQENAQLKGVDGVAQLQLEMERLKEQLAALQQLHFGTSSEKLPRAPGVKPPRTKPRRGHGPRTQPELPVQQVLLPLDDADKVCGLCGEALHAWEGQTEDAEEVTVVKRSFVLRRLKRQKYRCGHGCAPVTAPAPPRLIPGGRYSVDFAVHVALMKYGFHLPLARQEKLYAREGLVVESQTLWDQLEALARHLEKSYEALLAEVFASPLIHADETHWHLLMPGTGTRWYVWTVASPHAVYHRMFPSRSGATAKSVLGDFEGVVLVDGYAAYQTATKSGADGPASAQLAFCWAHVRRKFFEAAKTKPVCQEVLSLIGQLYAIEADLPSPHVLTAEARTAALAHRLVKSRKLCSSSGGGSGEGGTSEGLDSSGVRG